jgi:monoamine oxidase
MSSPTKSAHYFTEGKSMTKNGGVTRRNFLYQLGAAGGGAAAYQAMMALGLAGCGVEGAESGVGVSAQDELQIPNLAPSRRRKVAILGAGIAGMTAAYELSRAGYDCVILEATQRPGGRSLTVRAGDVVTETDSVQTCTFDRSPHMYLNIGPARIAYNHRALLGYCKRLRVALEPFVNHSRAAFVHEAAFDGVPLRQRQGFADTRGYIAELLAKCTQRGALDAELTAVDKEKLLAWLKSLGDLGTDYVYRGSSRGGFSNQPNAGLGGGILNEPLALARYLNSTARWQNFNEGLNQQPTMLQPVGGMDAITNAFAQHVHHLIQYQSVVREIRNTAEGATVAYTRHGQPASMTADFVICTIPTTVLKDIPNNFSAETQAAIVGIHYIHAVKIGFQSSRWWEDSLAIYGGITWTDQKITQMWYPSNGLHAEKGILLGAYTWAADTDAYFADLSPAARLAEAIAQGENVHPGYGRRVSRGISRAWGKVPFQLGSWAEGSENPEVLRKADGRVYFAGEHVSALPGWQEGSILSARRSVQAISQHALAQL